LYKSGHSNVRPVAAVLEADAAEFLRQAHEHLPQMDASTKLYAASQTLLLAMREERVVPALVEICSNLLGCEQLAIVEIERHTGTVLFLGEEGLSPEKREVLIRNEDVLEPRITPGSAWGPSDENGDSALISLGISALVPLWRDQKSSGALVLFQLLPHRRRYEMEDREVLQLLSLYAGPCLRSQSHE
jgi:hypothetical protein